MKWQRSYLQKHIWHKWFAWFPVSVRNNGMEKWAWREQIWRRMTCPWGDCYYEYDLEKKRPEDNYRP